MSAVRALTVCWCLALQLLTAAPGTSSLFCQKTETGYQPHPRDCGPTAKGCRIIVKPYTPRNDSAVAACRSDERGGEFTYDCAVECPAREKWDWNEVECCTGENCNGDMKKITSQNWCFLSKPGKPQDDRISVCQANERCGLDSNTRETRCASESECKGGGSIRCCESAENCGQNWGIFKLLDMPEEAQGKSKLVASLTLSLVALSVAWAAFTH